MPEKKKRSRFGEEFHELFPQLILPAGLGLISAYNPQATAAVRTGLAAADVFSDIRQRKYENDLAEQQAKGLQDVIAAEKAKLLAKKASVLSVEEATAKDVDNLRATAEETANFGLFGDRGPKMAASEPDPATKLEEMEFNDLFMGKKPSFFGNLVERTAPEMSLGAEAELFSDKGFQPDLAKQEIAPQLEKWMQGPHPEGIDTSGLERDIYFADIMAQTAAANPTVAGQMLGNWEYQKAGFDQEMARMREQISLYAKNAEQQQRWEKMMQEAEYGNRWRLIELEREISRERPIVHGSGTWFWKDKADGGEDGYVNVPESVSPDKAYQDPWKAYNMYMKARDSYAKNLATLGPNDEEELAGQRRELELFRSYLTEMFGARLPSIPSRNPAPNPVPGPGQPAPAQGQQTVTQSSPPTSDYISVIDRGEDVVRSQYERGALTPEEIKEAQALGWLKK